MKKILITCLVISTLVGCATTANFEKMLSTWVGASEDSLISRWGPPSRVYQSGSNKYLTFDRSSSGYVPGTSPTYQTTVIGNTAYTQSYGGSAGYAYTQSCSVTFTVVNNQVATWRWEGNACRL